MTIKKIFLDANIFNDIFDENRNNHSSSKNVLLYALQNDIKVYTSCDIITNIYYITAKYTSSEQALTALHDLQETIEIIPFAKDELRMTITLMKEDSDYKDMEDTIQYILALQEKCGFIISNDKKFVSKEILTLNSTTFCQKFNINYKD